DVVTHLLGSLLAQYGRQVVLEDDRASGELMNRHDRDGASSDVDWVVIASGRPVSPSVGGVGTGRRTIIAAELALSPHADDSTSWMETTRRGWVFMAPTGDGTALVQAMVLRRPSDPPAELMGLLADTHRVG